MKLTNKKNGFTIVELVIVIAVIAILAAVLIPTFSGVVAKANASAAQQTAMNGVKAGLMMTSTATLPNETFILVDSDKNVTTKPDYGYVYTGNSLGDPVAMYTDGGDFKTATFIGTTATGADVILVNNECIKECTLDQTAATAAAALTGATYGEAKFEALLKYMVAIATGKTAADVTITTKVADAKVNDAWVVTGTEVTVEMGETDRTFTVYTSPDMPANTVVFVKMG